MLGGKESHTSCLRRLSRFPTIVWNRHRQKAHAASLSPLSKLQPLLDIQPHHLRPALVYLKQAYGPPARAPLDLVAPAPAGRPRPSVEQDEDKPGARRDRELE